MQAVARLRKIRLSPQKARLVVNKIRGLRVEVALSILNHLEKKAAPIIKKVLESAIANAEHNHGLDVDRLKISMICVDQGSTYKRTQARAKGRGARILKPTSHIKIQVASF